jgi:hypothetical protein
VYSGATQFSGHCQPDRKGTLVELFHFKLLNYFFSSCRRFFVATLFLFLDFHIWVFTFNDKNTLSKIKKKKKCPLSAVELRRLWFAAADFFLYRGEARTRELQREGILLSAELYAHRLLQ